MKLEIGGNLAFALAAIAFFTFLTLLAIFG